MQCIHAQKNAILKTHRYGYFTDWPMGILPSADLMQPLKSLTYMVRHSCRFFGWRELEGIPGTCLRCLDSA